MDQFNMSWTTEVLERKEKKSQKEKRKMRYIELGKEKKRKGEINCEGKEKWEE